MGVAARWFDRIPARAYVVALVGIFAILGSLWRFVPAARDGFIDPQLWGPTVRDEGFNVASTLLLALIAVLLLLWFLRLLQSYGEHIDLDLVWAVQLFNLWGPILRVLEDADLFRPFGEDVVRYAPGLPSSSPCAPQVPGGFLHDCFGALLVTPPIWIWACLLIFVFARTALVAERAGDGHGLRRALAVFGLSLLLFVLLDISLWAWPFPAVRFVPPPWMAAVAAGVSFGVAAWFGHREARFRWRRGLLAYGCLPLFLGLYYVGVWFAGGTDGWRPTRPQNPTVLVGLVVVPVLLAFGLRIHAQALGGGGRKAAAGPGRLVGFLVYLLLFEAAVVFVGLAALVRPSGGAQGVGLVLLGPSVIAAGHWFSRRAARAWGTHAALLRFADPLNVLLVASQALDAFMTAVAIDLFGSQEKHVVPNLLMDAVRALHLPAPLGDHPAAFAMLGYKIPLALAAIWILDMYVAGPTERRRHLVLLVKLGAIGVGMVPALRDGLRLAMGV